MLILDLNDKLTNNFQLKEFLVSKDHPDLAAKLHLTVNKYTENLFYLCQCILQPVREKFDVSIHISSGYRDIHLNSVTKGSSPASSHRIGKAADVYTDDKSLLPVIFEFIKTMLKGLYSELILYRDDAGEPRFIHVAFTTHRKRNTPHTNDNAR